MSHHLNPVRIAGTMLLFGTVAVMAQPIQFHFRSFDLPGATTTTALGVNPEESIVGRYVMAGVGHGYVLSNGTVSPVDPPYGIPGTSAAWGVNPEGDIVGLYTDYGTVVGGDKFRTRAYLRDTSGAFTALDFPGAENTFAIKISPTGQVVGCYHHQNADFDAADGGTMHGYVYQNGNWQSLSVPGTMNNGITQDGRIIVGVWWPGPNEYHAYKVVDGVYSLLDLPSYAVRSDARDVNPSGEIVGFFIDSSNKSHGFLLGKDSFTTIDFPGANVVLTRAWGIDPEGDIVGIYGTTDGRTHGFLATRSPGRAKSILLP
jgi:uncharacterized membrane protein